MMIAVTGDDEDNMLICQVAKEKYLVDRIIARVNNPRNRQHFELLGVKPVRLRDGPDPAADRARGARVRAGPSARPARGAAGDHRDAPRRGLAGGGPAGGRSRDARGAAADLGAAAERAGSCPTPTRCWRPATRCSPCSTRAGGGPEGLLRPRRCLLAGAGESAMAERRRTSCWSGAAWRPPTARPSCGGAGRRARSCWSGGSRAAVRAAAAHQGVPARRPGGGRVRAPAGVVRGERR